jgi:hypothetical protein
MDEWKTHVHLEILDATLNKPRLLEILEHLYHLDQADLIPEDTARYLFNSIYLANKTGENK